MFQLNLCNESIEMLDHVYAGPMKTLTSVPIDCPFCDVSCFFYHVLIGIDERIMLICILLWFE